MFATPLIFAQHPDQETPIGYIIYNNTVEIWNTQDNYYFNKSSGIQFTNHYNDYWTRNIFCLNKYNGSDWENIKCADQLSNFNRDIKTDNLTYVNATLWKDFTYEGFDLRLAIRYHLKTNDKNLSVIISIKNIDVDDIPYKLGFVWNITDIEIPNDIFLDSIDINNSDYDLSDNLDLSFENMSIPFRDFNATGSNFTNYTYIPYFTIFERFDQSFLRLDWSRNLKYKVDLYSNGNQSNSHVTLLIDGGFFNAGVEKSTTLYWIDAEFDFISEWSTSNGNDDPICILANETSVLVTDGDTVVYEYYLNGTFISTWEPSASGNDHSYGIAGNSTNILLTDTIDTKVYVYYRNRSFLYSWDLDAGNPNANGLIFNGSNVWVVDSGTIFAHQYYENGTFIKNVSLTGANGSPRCMGETGSWVYVSDNTDDIYYRYDYEFNFNQTFPVDGSNTNPVGITYESGKNNFYVVSRADDIIEKYEGLPDDINPDVIINQPLNQTYTTNTIEFNVTATDNLAVDDVVYSLNSGTINNTMEKRGDEWNATNTTMQQGSTTVIYYANDTLNNLNDSETVTFFIDSINPNINFTNPTETDGSFVNQNYIEINVTATDTNLEAIVVRLFNSTGSQINKTQTLSSPNYLNITSLADGFYQFNATSNDTLNNVNNSDTRNVTLDTTNPDISYTAPTTGDNTNQSNTDIFINVSVTETNEDTITFLIYNSTGEYNSTSFTDATRTINFTGLADDVYTFNVTVNDSAGNSNTTSARSVSVDTINPDISYTAPTTGDNTNQSNTDIFINVSVTETNEDTITFLIYNSTGEYNSTSFTDATRTINFTGLPDDLYKFNVTVNDSAGNINRTSTRTVSVDTIGINITYIKPINTSTHVSGVLIIEWTTDEVVESAKYTIDNGVTNTTVLGTTSFSPSDTFAAGKFNITVYATDTAGNENSHSENNVEVVSATARTVYPTMSLRGNQKRRNELLIIGISVDEEKGTPQTNQIIQADIIYPNGSIWQNNLNIPHSANGFYRGTVLLTTDLPFGTYTVRANSSDFLIEGSFDLVSGTSQSIPSLSFITPTTSAGSLNQTFIFANVTASDDDGIDTLTLELFNSTGLFQTNSSTSNLLFINYTGLAFGDYNLNATVNDTLGIESTITRFFNLTALILFGNGTVKSSYKINESRFGNGDELSNGEFGRSVANIGDLDGDGIKDIAVGEHLNDDGGTTNGAVWILFLNTSGGVKSEYKINESRFGNGNELNSNEFGISIANLGDLNNDGVQDIVVGESFNDDGGTTNGAVWILFLNTSGGVKSEYKINESRFGNGNELGGDQFGISIANLGDLDGDGVQDIAVGEFLNDDGGTDNGAVWILFLNTSGGVKSEYKINESRFGNGNELGGNEFGNSVANLGDLDGDGVQDIVVGEWDNDDGTGNNGAVWILFLNTSGGVKLEYKINESRFGNGDELNEGNFGSSVANLGDLDGDGVQDIAVGEYRNADGGEDNGAVWILFLQEGNITSIAPIAPSVSTCGGIVNTIIGKDATHIPYIQLCYSITFRQILSLISQTKWLINT